MGASVGQNEHRSAPSKSCEDDDEQDLPDAHIVKYVALPLQSQLNLQAIVRY